MENNVFTSGSSKDTEIQEFKALFAQQIKDLEDEQETRVLQVVSKYESEVQDWKDKQTNETDAHEELLALIRQEHSEAMNTLKAELEIVRAAKEEAASELDRINADTKEEMGRIRAEMEEIRQQLASKDAEAAELNKRVEELTDNLENASMSAMLKNTKKYKIKNVQIYGSSVSGSLMIKRAQQTISNRLEQLEIEYEFVDISVSEEAKLYMRRKNRGETQLPQIFTGGEYRGVFDDFEYAIETHQLSQFLGFDRVRGFVPRHKVGYEPTTLAQDGEDAEQGAGLPAVVVNGLGNRSTAASTSPLEVNNRKNGSGADIGTSMFLLSPGSHKFQSGNPTRMRPGFVQNASQMWDGVLKSDITRTKHDLGFSSTLIPDDDELDELFEQGVVTDADLEAMLQSV
ncbi:hypothetical protein EDD21DRAFT_388028 [Dissophora ornata]|nr:hypothetical protein EDD21DRAFT_388028 [Dissophora ornata]